ncbi:hypothetical protein SETIT_3G393300v2 [Setaria italica]|uniref:Uncharacterized protein n=1 Tax=Setaria italica TaxID=4555 RepID=A0A368QNS4_SETIT|nr:hypothetical protein SETIT_3G393300v2 [Setaria italica]
MDASTASAMRLLLLEPAMGFGSARLVMAPSTAAGARLPAGVRALEVVAVPAPFAGFASPRSTSSASRRGSLIVGALPRAFADARIGFASPGCSSSSRRRASSFVVGALPTGGRATNFFGEAVGGAGNALDCAIAAAVAGAGWSLSKGRCGVVARGGALTNMSPSDDNRRAAEQLVLSYDNMRSAKHIAAWVELARLKTTFEVSFDAGVLESGRDLRKLLEEIGELDPSARIYPWTTEACLGRLRAVIGREKLDMLMLATTPKDDEQFLWSAEKAEALIQAIEKLMATLHSVVILNEGWMRPSPRSLLYESCPLLLKRLLQCLQEFSAIVESTKFRSTQNSIRYRMLEEHALALEHVYAVALDIFQEVSPPTGPQEESQDVGKALRDRRIALFEQDVGLTDCMSAIGERDSKLVIQCLEHTSWEVRDRVLGPDSQLLEG